MGVYKCVCGDSVYDSSYPHNSGKLHSDLYADEDDFSKGRDVNECKNCGALAIEYPAPSNKIKFYVPFDKVCGNLLE